MRVSFVICHSASLVAVPTHSKKSLVETTLHRGEKENPKGKKNYCGHSCDHKESEEAYLKEWAT